MKKKSGEKTGGFSRREFIKASAVAVPLAAMAPGVNKAFATGSDKARVGLIGCGGRGTHDTTKGLCKPPRPLE